MLLKILQNRRLILIAGLSLLLGLAGCQQPPSEIHVGLLADLNTPGGEPSLNAAQLAVTTLNNNGGLVIGGRT
ncbi:MAG: hypothetical protein ACE5G0_14240, partial [Rhodothermales bacterium]